MMQIHHMAYKPIRMLTINQIRAYYHQGVSIKKISRLLGLSRNTVRVYIRKMKTLELAMDQEFDQPTIQLIHSDHHVQQSDAKADLTQRLPDICQQLSRVGVTRELLWDEYRASYLQG